MAYATKQDLIDRFGLLELVQLTDKVNKPVSTVDDVPVERALTDATALIDTYVGKAAQLPLSVVPPYLAKVACDLARYYLHGKAAEKEGPVATAYAEAMTWLKDVSKGLVSLDTEGVSPIQAGGGSVKASAPGRIFTRETLRDF